jgi:hypothetical protein
LRGGEDARGLACERLRRPVSAGCWLLRCEEQAEVERGGCGRDVAAVGDGVAGPGPGRAAADRTG